MSGSIIGRIDEMGNRIDDLEKSITELMEQAGIDASAPAEDDGKGKGKWGEERRDGIVIVRVKTL